MTSHTPPLPFVKMHSLGNDFMVCDAREDARWSAITAFPWQRWSDRRLGVGFDQALVLVDHPEGSEHLGYHVINADGSVVHQCLNGARCVGHYLWEARPGCASRWWLHSSTCSTALTVSEGGVVSAELPLPSSAPLQGLDGACHEGHALPTFYAVDVGNPHVLAWVEDVASAPLGLWVGFLKASGIDANVSAVQAMDATGARVRMRVVERGSGETLACGSAAVAAAALMANQTSATTLEVAFREGGLTLRLDDERGHVHVEGPVNHVYTGWLR